MLNAYLFFKFLSWLGRLSMSIIKAPIEFIYCYTEKFPHGTSDELFKTIGICIRTIVFAIIVWAILAG